MAPVGKGALPSSCQRARRGSPPLPHQPLHTAGTGAHPKPGLNLRHPPSSPPSPPSPDIPNWSMLRRYPMSVRPSRSRTRCFSAAEGRGKGSATATRGHQHPPCRVASPNTAWGSQWRAGNCPSSAKGSENACCCSPTRDRCPRRGGKQVPGEKQGVQTPLPGGTGRPTGDGTLGEGGSPAGPLPEGPGAAEHSLSMSWMRLAVPGM